MQSSSRFLHRLQPPARAMLWLLLCGLMTASAEAQTAGRPDCHRPGAITRRRGTRHC